LWRKWPEPLIDKGIQAARDQPADQTSLDMLSFFEQAAANGMTATQAMEEWWEKIQKHPQWHLCKATETAPSAPSLRMMVALLLYVM
jgi:hypothetical protein